MAMANAVDMEGAHPSLGDKGRRALRHKIKREEKRLKKLQAKKVRESDELKHIERKQAEYKAKHADCVEEVFTHPPALPFHESMHKTPD